MAINTVEIPLISAPQTFGITLAGVPFSMRVSWNKPAQYWLLDIADGNDAPIIQGIPLLPSGDLLAQYAYLGIAGHLWVLNDAAPGVPPGWTDLGVTSHLYFQPTT